MGKIRYVHAEVETPLQWHQYQAQSELYGRALQHVLQQGCRFGENTTEEERQEAFTLLARMCHDYGVEECFAIVGVRMDVPPAFREQAELVIANLYASQRAPLGLCRRMPAAQRRQLMVDDFLRRNYHLRFNEMTRETEFASRTHRDFSYHPLTDRDRYEMRTRMEREGIALTDNDLRQRLSSSEVRDFCPMWDFLSSLPKWDKKPRIKKLAETIPTNNKDWPERFYRWFLSMVAHWRMEDTRYGNSIIPVLVGPQGCGKSQWIRNLLPVELADYYHDGFSMSRRNEAERLMTRYALINIDEFDAIPARQEPVLKHLIQLTNVHIDGQACRRFCSFIATSNHYDLHRDTSGSRRYIFVDIAGEIRLDHRLSLLQVYAEALYAIEQGRERTYFTKAEERAMQQDNEEFRERDISEQLFLHYYEPLPTRAEVAGGQWLTALEISQSLERLSKKDFGLRRVTRFGAILRKHCPKQGTKRGKTSTLYHVRLKSTASSDES